MFGERERIAEDAAISALITDWERGARKAMDRLFAVQDYAWVTLALGGRGWEELLQRWGGRVFVCVGGILQRDEDRCFYRWGGEGSLPV